MSSSASRSRTGQRGTRRPATAEGCSASSERSLRPPGSLASRLIDAGSSGPTPSSPQTISTGPGRHSADRRLPFETNVPAVFAAGDVRSGSMKRVVGRGRRGSERRQLRPPRARCARRAPPVIQTRPCRGPGSRACGRQNPQRVSAVRWRGEQRRRPRAGRWARPRGGDAHGRPGGPGARRRRPAQLGGRRPGAAAQRGQPRRRRRAARPRSGAAPRAASPRLPAGQAAAQRRGEAQARRRRRPAPVLDRPVHEDVGGPVPRAELVGGRQRPARLRRDHGAQPGPGAAGRAHGPAQQQGLRHVREGPRDRRGQERGARDDRPGEPDPGLRRLRHAVLVQPRPGRHRSGASPTPRRSARTRRPARWT